MKVAIAAAAALAFACRPSPSGSGSPAPFAIAPPVVTRSAAERPRRIFRLFPPSTPAGAPFNPQEEGYSAILVAGWGFREGDRIFWNGRELATSRADPSTISALVPKDLFGVPGTATITIRDPADPRSTPVEAVFRILKP